MTLGDQNLDGHMSFEEFVKYVTDHQKKLWIVFKSIDQDGSGKSSVFHITCFNINNLILILIRWCFNISFACGSLKCIVSRPRIYALRTFVLSVIMCLCILTGHTNSHAMSCSDACTK